MSSMVLGQQSYAQPPELRCSSEVTLCFQENYSEIERFEASILKGARMVEGSYRAGFSQAPQPHKIVSFRKDSQDRVTMVFHTESLKRILERRGGVFIPAYLREKFGNTNLVPTDDSRIYEAFCESMWPVYQTDTMGTYSWIRLQVRPLPSLSSSSSSSSRYTPITSLTDLPDTMPMSPLVDLVKKTVRFTPQMPVDSSSSSTVLGLGENNFGKRVQGT